MTTPYAYPEIPDTGSFSMECVFIYRIQMPFAYPETPDTDRTGNKCVVYT
jgi:hypothetical protein